MKILFIPLDERPCNQKYPYVLLSGNKEIELHTPPANILSNAKTPANIDALWAFVNAEIAKCDCAILSMDMLVYGGLIPSRIHQTSQADLIERCDRLYALKAANPSVLFYGYDCIMRIPSYNGNGEEPLYYGTYGQRIFQLSELMCKKATGILSTNDAEKMVNLAAEIPQEYTDDYFNRRAINKNVTSRALQAVKDGVFEQFVLPQDDAAVYGVQVLEQQEHIARCRELNLENKVFVYPGADEVGLTLISKAICDYKKVSPTVFIRYSSLTGPFVVPSFEDRPYAETIKWQLLSAGLTIIDNSKDADIVFMANVPGEMQKGANQQFLNIRENSSKRNLLEFVRAAKYYIAQGKHVAIGDVAYGNGGDVELLKLMLLEEIQDKISAYAGWNTDANTLGTVIAFSIVSLFFGVNKQFLYYRYLEDCGYQSIIRQTLYNTTYVDSAPFNEQNVPLCDCAMNSYNDFIAEYIAPSFASCQQIKSVSFPWERLFEIDLHF